MPEINNVLAEFLVDQLPSTMMEALQALTSLNYPIYDQKSLRLQLEEVHAGGQERDGEQEAAARVLIDRVTNTFEPADFGLDTVQSALEKFAGRTGGIDFSPVIPGPWPGGPVLDRRFRDDWWIGETIPQSPVFGDDPCGKAAEQLWQEHLEGPLTAVLGPSPAERDWLQERAARCRLGRLPTFSDNPRCEEIAQLAYARCRILGGNPRSCTAEAREAMASFGC